jgi:hypothetical protein
MNVARLSLRWKLGAIAVLILAYVVDALGAFENAS